MVFYDHSGRSMSADLAKVRQVNRRQCQERFAVQIALNRRILDCQHALAGEYIWMIDTILGVSANRAVSLMAAVLHKNFFLLHAAHGLTRDGLFGPARTLLRPCFEGLAIAKYSAVAEDGGLLTRWTGGQQINVSVDVFSRLRTPDVSPLSQFWRVLCRYAHATVYSQQARADFSEGNLGENFGLEAMLLHMNAHMLARHLLTSNLDYYAKRYANKERVVRERARLQALCHELLRAMTPKARDVVRAYRTTWHLKGAA